VYTDVPEVYSGSRLEVRTLSRAERPTLAECDSLYRDLLRRMTGAPPSALHEGGLRRPLTFCAGRLAVRLTGTARVLGETVRFLLERIGEAADLQRRLDANAGHLPGEQTVSSVWRKRPARPHRFAAWVPDRVLPKVAPEHRPPR
jgi:hypothetical protein